MFANPIFCFFLVEKIFIERIKKSLCSIDKSSKTGLIFFSQGLGNSEYI